MAGSDNSYKDYDAKGIRLRKGHIFTPDAEVLLSWNVVAKRIEKLIQQGRYLSDKKKTEYAAYKEEQEKSHVYTIGGLELNEETVEVTVDGEAVKLTPMEFKIVQLLIKNPGRVFSADEIYERIWNEKAVNTDTIMVHVRNIREKIEIDPRNPKYLKVVWGVGYKIDKQ